MSQFFYIHPENPQGRLIQQAVDIIKKGGVIVYPTDSGYALGCGIGEKQAMDRIVAIRKLPENHNFTLVCSDLSELSNYALVTNQSYRLIKNNVPNPYTFILPATKEVPRRLLTKRKTIGIRVPDNAIALVLIAALSEPILSCSLMLPDETITQSDPDMIRDYLEHQVDLIIHGGYLGQAPTTVVDLTQDSPDIIRIGSGDPRPFQSF
ncbi:threonylcarbamoyl-AMP synthase [Muribacter muris]|uniref:Threonylcarbamoyl-AMP synthase n=1 Tax=Muribacter muris TaxID=67855 RepID=A0A4Y9K0B2_9PAST|nr:L-threonylcarbamoyladenylate synthase [Muribacter muris]MBF0785184.1 threonylcarbamoyl-AMP synthase [Muribacter muris]MBF0827402.1 threonylcarbamoyl-AMP synthase [Muribacter muris]TFV10135.1 threonylcarbamoyl-AMP synthase [Muribacter muris]